MLWWDNLVHGDGPVMLVRAFYLLSALGIVIVRLTPPLRDRFLDYGARSTAREKNHEPNTTETPILRTLDSLAQKRVLHTGFSDFYILSLVCLAFWVPQIYTDDGVIVNLLRYFEYGEYHGARSRRVGLCLILFAIQSVRRLFECWTLSKQSTSSSMWIGHYLIGLAFYFFTNIAIFIDHVRAGVDDSHLISLSSPDELALTLLDQVAIAMFFVASVEQYQYHSYLASLRKYTVPDGYAFKLLIAPHYTAECVIYVCLAVISAPRGQHVNVTMLSALLFVVVNLGITAEGTKRWMLGKFPERRKDVESRWRMLPMVF